MNRRLAPVVVGALIGLLGIGFATPASAHPLGNFSVNHYHGLQLHPDRIDDLAILDEAEIPTLQEKPTVDANADGTVSPTEAATFAEARCRELAAAARLTVDGHPLPWTVVGSDFGYHPGAANLATSRTQCQLTATVDLRRDSTVDFADSFRADRVGWHEITAVGDGIGLRRSDVPATSASDDLRHYPTDLLTSPLGQHSAHLATTMDTSGLKANAATTITAPGIVGRFLNALTSRFYDIAGSPHLGLTVGLLGVGLALLLGAAHAALPGHGKTVMAAYIAGRRGTIRDAVTVGATVTATHTAGVLILGLLLTVLAGLVGEVVLGWLGVLSGLVIAGIGLTLLRSALRRRLTRPRPAAPAPAQPHAHDPHTAVPIPIPIPATVARMPMSARSGPASAAQLPGEPGRRPGHDHPHHDHSPYDHRPHGHAHHDHFPQDHIHRPVPAAATVVHTPMSARSRAARIAPSTDARDHEHPRPKPVHDGHSGDHRHPRHTLTHGGPAHSHDESETLGRRGLIGMGIAGGLVPSPSALVVLLGAIALGRTWFGILLVVAYGAGMAGTLTAAGLLLVVLRQRLDATTSARFGHWSSWLSAVTPILTAALVLVVGLGLALRGLLPLLPGPG